MYFLEAEDFIFRGSPHCSTGPPVTPGSVVGTDILDGSCIDLETPKSHMQHDLAPSTQLLNMLKTENAEQYQVKPNYLHSSVIIRSPQESRDQGVSERCRRRTCEWMYEITGHFELKREVVGIAMFYVDRYFTIFFEEDASGQVAVTRRQFQLVGLTGLYIAIKLHGKSCQESQPWNHLKFSLAICASISRDQFTLREIEECEMTVLNALDWHVNPIVSSGAIIDSLLMYIPSSMSARIINGSINENLALFVFESAKYLAQRSISVPALSLVYKPSVVAYASILHALDALSYSKSDSCLAADYENLISQVSSHHFDLKKEHVEDAKKILNAICPYSSKQIVSTAPDCARVTNFCPAIYHE